MPYSAWAPLASSADLVILLVRVIMGGVMVYYGWPKVKDPRKTFEDFAKIGFTPGWFWGTIVLLVEFAGGRNRRGLLHVDRGGPRRRRDAERHAVEDPQGAQALPGLFVRS